jgi:hypothetical protein
MWVRIDYAAGTTRPVQLDDHHEGIAALSLHAGVPQDVALQFETARNLYLYAWFVYRFYPVAEHHSLACLELALRDRLKDDVRAGKVGGSGRQPMLRALLRYAVAQGLVKNEGFQTWRNRGEINARSRVEMGKMREMSEKNLTEISWDDSELELTAEDLNWDYANMLVDTLPYIRNEYAHGSTNLHNLVLHTIQIVCEIINQLYEAPGTRQPADS